MDTHNEGSSSEMGGSDILDFSKIEREINALLHDDDDDDDSINLPNTSVSQVHAEVDEKFKYFQQMIVNINKEEEKFVNSCLETDMKIDLMMKTIICNLEERQRNLKNDLSMIAKEKLRIWNHQLSVCKEALNRLPNTAYWNKQNSLIVENHDLIKEIEFDHDVEVKFHMRNYTGFIKSLQNLGSIECSSSLNLKNSGVDSREIKPKFIFGSSGSNPGQFCRPWGVCTDFSGRILICDRSNHRVQIFSQTGEFLLQFGQYGSQKGYFNRPSGIGVDSKCRIVVSDKDNHRIQVFTCCGKFIFEFGGAGSKPGKFNYPWDVAVNYRDEIAVSDSKNHRVQLFNKRGSFISLFDAKKLHINHPRKQLNMLDSPRGLAFRNDGALMITDFNNHRILILDPNFRTYSCFGSEGTSPAKFFRPQGIACDEQGNFVVADSKNFRVQLFDKNKKLIRIFGSQGSEAGEFDCPQGIAIDIFKNIIVVDFSNNRIQVF